MTVQQLINWALRLIGVLAAGESPTTEEGDDALAALNRIIGSWNEVMDRVMKGTFASIFYTFVPLAVFATKAETINATTHPLAIQRALAFALALDLAAEYGRQAPPEVAANAQQARAAVMTLPQPPTV